jgi:hypothetical protein
MPNLKEYPKGFSPLSKPSKPTKPAEPKKTFTIQEDGRSIPLYDGDILDLSFLKEGEQVKVNVDYGYYDNDKSYSLVVFKKSEIQNITYKHELARYQERLKKYNVKLDEHKNLLKEWTLLKKRWDEEVEKEKEDYERKIFEQLKEKFEK